MVAGWVVAKSRLTAAKSRAAAITDSGIVSRPNHVKKTRYAMIKWLALATFLEHMHENGGAKETASCVP